MMKAAAAMALGVLALVSCEKPGTQAASQSDASRKVEFAQVPVKIRDPLGRWQTTVSLAELRAGDRKWGGSAQASSLNVLPGYVHVLMEDVSNEPHLKVNCFVYEQPLHPGEAVDQLIRAISPGLEFVSVSPLSLTATGGQPELEFSLNYRSTFSQEPPGQAHFLLSTREAFPILCSAEGEAVLAAQKRMMREFSKYFELRSSAAHAGYSEIWSLHARGGEAPLGFRSLLVSEQGSDRLYLSEATWFSLSTRGTKNRDRVIRELVGVDGALRWGQWLDLFDGAVDFRGQVERIEGGASNDETTSYRYALEYRGEVMKGEFTVAQSLRSWLGHEPDSVPSEESAALLFYPYLSPNGASSCVATSGLSNPAGSVSVECRPVAPLEPPRNFPNSLCRLWSRSERSWDHQLLFSGESCQSATAGGDPDSERSLSPSSPASGLTLAYHEALLFRRPTPQVQGP